MNRIFGLFICSKIKKPTLLNVLNIKREKNKGGNMNYRLLLISNSTKIGEPIELIQKPHKKKKKTLIRSYRNFLIVQTKLKIFYNLLNKLYKVTRKPKILFSDGFDSFFILNDSDLKCNLKKKNFFLHNSREIKLHARPRFFISLQLKKKKKIFHQNFPFFSINLKINSFYAEKFLIVVFPLIGFNLIISKNIGLIFFVANFFPGSLILKDYVSNRLGWRRKLSQTIYFKFLSTIIFGLIKCYILKIFPSALITILSVKSLGINQCSLGSIFNQIPLRIQKNLENLNLRQKSSCFKNHNFSSFLEFSKFWSYVFLFSEKHKKPIIFNKKCNKNLMLFNWNFSFIISKHPCVKIFPEIITFSNLISCLNIFCKDFPNSCLIYQFSEAKISKSPLKALYLLWYKNLGIINLLSIFAEGFNIFYDNQQKKLIEKNFQCKKVGQRNKIKRNKKARRLKIINYCILQISLVTVFIKQFFDMHKKLIASKISSEKPIGEDKIGEQNFGKKYNWSIFYLEEKIIYLKLKKYLKSTSQLPNFNLINYYIEIIAIYKSFFT